MKYRLTSYWNHFKKAKHRGGHGIHSPFLFRLITEVIESKTAHPDYSLLKQLDSKSHLHLIADKTIQTTEPKDQKDSRRILKGLRKIDLPMRYRKLIYRLVLEFKPTAAIYFGPTLGHNLAAMALGSKNMPVYHSDCHLPYGSYSEMTLTVAHINTVSRIQNDAQPPIKPEFIVINHPNEPKIALHRIEEQLNDPGKNDVLVLIGIHKSTEINQVWQDLILNQKVHVTLTLFNLGIALFRDKSQKENFELKF
ncbi:MAG: hypothetical protein NTV75_02000 [Bacteroidia bacterium]|nr:hypothetical protein [Bacteroidia bacterium]